MNLQFGEFAIVPFFIGIALIILAICVSKSKKKSSAAKKEKNKSEKVLCSTFLHINGLPIAENVPCEVLSLIDKYEFKANGATFNLDKGKITDICVKTETEIQQQYVSSVGGAVGGAMLFGPLGGIIGGRAKKKKTKIISQYLIFTYLKEEELKYIGFDVTGQGWNAGKIVDEYRNNCQSKTVSIDL